jgi:hypothetical protein
MEKTAKTVQNKNQTIKQNSLLNKTEGASNNTTEKPKEEKRAELSLYLSLVECINKKDIEESIKVITESKIVLTKF